jgi:hypothetical protein
MNNLKLRVHWFQERANENDDNNGYHFGIYTFDCTEADFDVEAGYGSYDVLDAEWFKTEAERDNVFMLEVLEAELVADAIQGDTTVLAELLKSVPSHIIYASLSDKGQEAFEPIPSDLTTITIESEEAVEIIANNVAIMIKHNDVGISLDFRPSADDEAEPFIENQVWFEDVPEGDFMCTNCGGGFHRSEIITDEDGDDFCNSCK